MSVLHGHSVFSSPPHKGQWPPTSKDFYTRAYPLHYFLILILEKESVFSFSMLGAKQGNFWYHFYNVFGMTRSLTGDWTRDLPHSMPALYHLAIEEAFCLGTIKYASKFQSDMLYLLKLWYFLFFSYQLLYSYTVDKLAFGQNSRSWVNLLNF